MQTQPNSSAGMSGCDPGFACSRLTVDAKASLFREMIPGMIVLNMASCCGCKSMNRTHYNHIDAISIAYGIDTRYPYSCSWKRNPSPRNRGGYPAIPTLAGRHEYSLWSWRLCLASGSSSGLLERCTTRFIRSRRWHDLQLFSRFFSDSGAYWGLCKHTCTLVSQCLVIFRK